MTTTLILYPQNLKKYDVMDYFAGISKKYIFAIISTAVTNIILYVVWQLEHGGIISSYI